MGQTRFRFSENEIEHGFQHAHVQPKVCKSFDVKIAMNYVFVLLLFPPSQLITAKWNELLLSGCCSLLRLWRISLDILKNFTEIVGNRQQCPKAGNCQVSS